MLYTVSQKVISLRLLNEYVRHIGIQVEKSDTTPGVQLLLYFMIRQCHM